MDKMIEKKVHYIWFGGEKTIEVNKCILSWKDKLPDYEIIEWNEKNLNLKEEIENNIFLKKCYNRHLWAFLADYFRFKILYEEGGIYLDTDITVIKKFDNLLSNDFFIGKESDKIISAGVIGCNKGNPFVKKMVQYYDFKIMTEPEYIVTTILTKYENEIYKMKDSVVLESNFFYPYGFHEDFDFNCISGDTYTIHWWSKSWGGKASNHVFLQTKHIKNPVIKFMVKIKKYLGYFYYKKIKKNNI